MIIDSHVHIYPDAIAGRASGSIASFYSMPTRYDGSARVLLDSCGRAGVQKCVLCSVATAPAQVGSINTFLAGEKTRLGFAALCALHPQMTEAQLAGALDFGQCRKYGGFGCYWAKDFDDHDISYGFAYDRKEEEQIDLEGNRGTVTRMVLPGSILGVNFALATKFKDDELTNIIQGGTLIRGTADTPGMYIIPNSEFRGCPSFTCEIFLPLYGQGTSNMDQITAMERRIYPNCTGTEGDVPAEAKAWANYSYNIKAVEPKDESGKSGPSFLVPQYTWDQYDALHIEDI
jgi:hypothetical protein